MGVEEKHPAGGDGSYDSKTEGEREWKETEFLLRRRKVDPARIEGWKKEHPDEDVDMDAGMISGWYDRIA